MRIEAGGEIGNNAYKNHAEAIEGAFDEDGNIDSGKKYNATVDGKRVKETSIVELYTKVLNGEL
ncbi:MAG: hypothetical protein KKA52_00465 [Candidatus Omnitrophica bacterium]|nr:hypothetical protein [Candidatus Omnitrophota bacterium]